MGELKPPARVAFGKAVERLRGKGKTQTELAGAIDQVLGRSTKYSKQGVISAVENGKSYVALEDVFAIAAALGVTPVDMLTAWAEEVDPDQVIGWRAQRAHLLRDLDALQATVRQATTTWLEESDSGTDGPELATLAAELMLMPKRKRRLLFRVVGILNIQEDEK